MFLAHMRHGHIIRIDDALMAEGMCVDNDDEAFHLTNEIHELVNPYSQFTDADWSTTRHLYVLPTCCTIEVDGRVIMQDGKFAI